MKNHGIVTIHYSHSRNFVLQMKFGDEMNSVIEHQMLSPLLMKSAHSCQPASLIPLSGLRNNGADIVSISPSDKNMRLIYFTLENTGMSE